MTTGLGPYVGTDATDSDDSGVGSPAIETTLIASRQTVDIGGGVMAHAEVFNGAIPGPTIRLMVGDTLVVRLINDLPYPLGIHWHGLELPNYSDGTEITQNGVPGAPLQVLGNGVPAGGTFLYTFKVTRPGLFWYHPHHHNSLNQVFRGMYGMIVVTDPLEANIVAPAVGAVLPAAADTMQLVLSDITVCKGVGSLDPTYLANYGDPTTMPLADRPEWLSGRTDQVGPTPISLCEIAALGGNATDDMGAPAATSYLAGDVPSLAMAAPGRLTEGQTVLVNGVNVGARLGTPAAPGTLAVGASTKDVLAGQGLRLQISNCAHLRYFRLRLTTEAGAIVNLFRIGGEGGLLDNPILEGGMMGTLDTGFEPGEVLLPPAVRADVVAAIPAGLPVGSVLTLWTRDYQRAGNNNSGIPNTPTNRNWAQIPTVPVAHFKVTANAATTYTIGTGTTLRATAGMPAVEVLGAPDGILLNPVTIGKTGSGAQDMQTQTAGFPSIDGAVVPPAFMDSTPYTSAPHIGSTRYAETGKTLELTVTNASSGRAHHPFHLHGFSFQPKSLDQSGVPVYTWPYQEFRDTIDVPPDTTLRFRVRLDDRELVDGVTPGGALGRWMFHCHIFFHGHHGMMSELVVTTADGKEKPNINVGGSWAYAPVGGTATRQGTFVHRDGRPMTLTATKGTVLPAGPSAGGNWTWSYTSAPGDPASVEYVYITATDSDGRKDQTVFRLQIGGADAASDVGDPHIRTVTGRWYDFHAAGEFTLLRDREGMEVQVRQAPVETPLTLTDANSGLTTCATVNTAAAARVGSHRIAFQPFREPGRLQFLLDGKPAQVPEQGIDLEGHRVTTFDAAGEVGLRVDYAHGPVLTVTPCYWPRYDLRYVDVSVSNTNADEGVMGKIHGGTWLPSLPSGATVGPIPESLHERYVTLYQTFADAWRVADLTSMFEYLPWTSTATFTDRDWPHEDAVCTLKSEFLKPEIVNLRSISSDDAERICEGVTELDLHEKCVIDVAATGDASFATGYLLAQELRLGGTAIQIAGDKLQTRPGESLDITATVLPLTPGMPTPTGSITFLIDDVEISTPVELDKDGRASLKTERLRDGVHRIRARYSPGGENVSRRASPSPSLLHPVERQDGTVRGAPYEMRGLFYEACDCFTVCPCWLGNSPDEGECTGVFAWEIEAGSIDGVDVAGLRAVSVSQHAGLRDDARQRVMIFVDDRATRVQADALTAAFSGSLGGPLQELGDLLGEMLGVERAPIEIRREGRLTTLTVDRRIRVEGTSREGPSGRMTLSDGTLSEVLGSPAEVGESGRFRVALATHGVDLDLRGRSTMSGRFAYQHVPGTGAPGPVAPGPGHMG
ncbi:MAG TPA: DUF1326 domain-containing protein [Thermomicrobiales bacterium]|nr:DUF1326 domain-containing protein [Thermomicrobiales bacterium]